MENADDACLPVALRSTLEKRTMELCVHKNTSKLMLSNTNTLAATATSRSQETPCSDKNFPSRLFRFLNLVESYDLSHIASWQPHGRCFRIHNPKEFVNLTEPRYVNIYLSLNLFTHIRLIFYTTCSIVGLYIVNIHPSNVN